VSNDLPEVLRAWCAARGVAFADTTPELRERVRRGEAVYFADDVHWNGAGHAVAAELVARRLRELGWLDGGEEDA
jgi:lysophospholipase L1-like esterase